MAGFTASFSYFRSSKTAEIFLLGERLGARYQFQEFQRFSWNFVISEVLKS